MKNFQEKDLYLMTISTNVAAREKGRRLLYHLQYVKDGKINIKPEGKNETEEFIRN